MFIGWRGAVRAPPPIHDGDGMPLRPTLEDILSKLESAESMRRSGDLELAERFVRSALEEAEALDLSSSSAHLLLARVLDQLDRPELAFHEAGRALQADPLDLRARALFRELARRLRAWLCSPQRSADDTDIPRLYTQLVQAEEADLGSHLMMVRYSLATGRLEHAREVAEALVVLEPCAREAWAELARVARAQRNELRALDAEARVAALGGASPLAGSARKVRA